MRVNLAFQLFSEHVHKWLFCYKRDLQQKFRILKPTKHFLKPSEKFIFLKVFDQTQKVQFLEDFLILLSVWEEREMKHGGGFLSAETALGLRVTQKSMLSLVDYVTSKLQYKYLLTANSVRTK